jgi:hypothetical protein
LGVLGVSGKEGFWEFLGGFGGGVVSDFFLDISHHFCKQLFFVSFFVSGFVGWGLGGIPGTEAERTTCPNKRGRDKTQFCH